jgi:hypothetical protein
MTQIESNYMIRLELEGIEQKENEYLEESIMGATFTA